MIMMPLGYYAARRRITSWKRHNSGHTGYARAQSWKFISHGDGRPGVLTLVPRDSPRLSASISLELDDALTGALPALRHEAACTVEKREAHGNARAEGAPFLHVRCTRVDVRKTDDVPILAHAISSKIIFLYR